MTVGDRIKKIRNKRDYTLRDLSRMANISPSFLSDIENNRSSPSLKRLKDIAKALDVKVSYLLGENKSYDIPNEDPVEIKELLERYHVMLEGEELDEDTKKSVIDFLRLLRDRDKKSE